MRKLLAFAILGLVGFYVVWPAWSGYRIAAALQSNDPVTLAGKIDFPSVRESLRPVVTGEVDKRLTQQMSQLGGGAGQLLTGDLKKQLMPKVVDGVLAALVTPENVIRIANDSGGVVKAIEKIVAEQAGKAAGGLGAMMPGGGGASGGVPAGAGGLGNILGGVVTGGGLGLPGGLPALPGGLGAQPKPEAAPATAPPPVATTADGKSSSVGFANIKSFALDGPLGFGVSIAKDGAQSKPDLTAGMAFTGGDWKLVRLVPHL